MKNKSNDTYEKFAGVYDQLPFADQERTKHELDSLQVLLKERNIQLSDSTVVDLGGGTGRLAFPLSIHAKKVILVEPASEMLQVAKSKLFTIEHGEIEFREEGFLDLSLPASSVDIVISFNDPFQYLLNL